MTNAKQRYQQAMEVLYIACIVISGTALVAITLIIPLGVFMRYVDEQPAVLARAGVGHHDGDLLVPRRRGRVPRERAHRGRSACSMPCVRKCAAQCCTA